MAQEPVALEGAIAQRYDEFVKTVLAALDLRQFDPKAVLVLSIDQFLQGLRAPAYAMITEMLKMKTKLHEQELEKETTRSSRCNPEVPCFRALRSLLIDV